MITKSIDCNRLVVFYHIYKTQSISGAAKQLHATPSAVSQQLQKLEKEIGVRLFARPHKRVVATAEADELFSVIHPFLLSLDDVLTGFTTAKTVPSGVIRVGAPVEFGKIMMPRLIADYRVEYPDVRFQMRIGRTAELLPLVQGGELDFAYVDTFPTKMQGEKEWNGLQLQQIFQETVVLACSDTYKEQNLGEDYSYSTMKKQLYIAQQDDARAIKNWFYHAFSRRINEIDIVLTVANHQAVVNAILCDLGLGIVVAQMVKNSIASGKIQVINVGKKHPVNYVSLIQLMDKVPRLVETSFQRHIEKQIKRYDW